MTKYIDLLRTHQQQNKQAADDTSTTHADNIIDEQITTTKPSENQEKTGNPYSQATRNKNNEGPSPEPELIEEQDTAPTQIAKTESELDTLVTEDDEPSSVEKATDPQPQAATAQPPIKDSANTPGFHISTWLQNLSTNMLSIFQSAQQQKPRDFSELQGQIVTLLQQLEQDSKTLDALELEISRNIKNICKADISMNDLVEKSIMMMLYTIKIGLQLKLQHQELSQHTVAAMVHHIGMAMIPDDVRLKIGKLTKDEIKLIRSAPNNAVTYLESCHLEQDNIILAAAQSSERYDGSGSTGLSGHSIAWVARVVGLLSIFEALIHFRPYRQRLLPRDAIRELVNNHKKEFDPVILKALIEAVSLYPVGTFVQLNTGEIGQVISVHNKFPLRPIVYVSMDKHGNAITEREINLKQQPNLMIQKCMYEESLVDPQESAQS